MKTAVSIPDGTFERADRLARRTRRSRSKLFADALEEYLDRHAPDAVTEAMNATLTDVGETRDAFIAAAAARTLRESEW